MKRFLAIVGAIIMLSSFSEAKAESVHTWEPTFIFDYDIADNGGDFWYMRNNYYHNDDIGILTGGESLSSPAEATNAQNFGGNPGSMTLTGMAGGNLNEVDALVVETYAGIDYTSNLDEPKKFNATYNGVKVQQRILASIDRIFRVNTNGYCDLAASLDGPITFDTFEFLPDVSYAEYELKASVRLMEFRDDGGPGITDTVELVLNNDTRSGVIEDIPIFTSTGGTDIYYGLHADILLKTWVQNFNYDSFQSLDLSGQFQIGDGIDNPLMLTAGISTSAVPIPGTVVLLFSGLGGLTLMRRRFLRT
ncbi:MAG: VPLPA-CTERM sorting domain-containing protein [Desulfobulbaceae bacterium]|nr:VPLPA-CTERM sorting domain-containing protein [Desulfobulbaceae bacterium]